MLFCVACIVVFRGICRIYSQAFFERFLEVMPQVLDLIGPAKAAPGLDSVAN
jgi:hypothetical protein